MSTTARRIDYYYTTIKDRPGEAYKLLAVLKEVGVNLIAFSAIPVGPAETQLALFPDESGKLEHAARGARLQISGPNPAILVQGDDHMGVLAKLHEQLYDAGVNVYSSVGVTDGKGDFGYVIYVRPDSIDSAAVALGL